MQSSRPSSSPARLLIPWDGLTPIRQVLAFARTLARDGAMLALLPLTPEAAAQPPIYPLDTVTVLPVPRSGSPAHGIIEAAAADRTELILMATPCHPTGEFDPTCLAAEIALESPVPVMVVHFDCEELTAFPPLVKRLLVPLDGSLRSAQAIPLAERLARRMGLPVHLVTVIDINHALPPAFAYDPEASADVSAELHGEAGWALREAERLVSRHGVPVTSDIRWGEIVPSIEDARREGDVIVMTTHGIGGATQERLRSVAACLLSDSAAPLILMRSSQPTEIVVTAQGDRTKVRPLAWPTI